MENALLDLLDVLIVFAIGFGVIMIALRASEKMTRRGSRCALYDDGIAVDGKGPSH